MSDWLIRQGDALSRLREMPDSSAQCCITSPPYWSQRNYDVEGQIGLEETPEQFVAALVEVFAEVRRVLRSDGTLWLNLGDSYARGFGGGSPGKKSATNAGSYKGRKSRPLPPGYKRKDLVGIPWMTAFALRAEGWHLRKEIVWEKPNAMTESVKDRPSNSHEHLFLLAKDYRYSYDAVMEEGRDGLRNKRSVWTIATESCPGAEVPVMPIALVEPCVLAGSKPGDLVLDPFAGAATTGLVATRLGRDFIGVELDPGRVELGRTRIQEDAPSFFSAVAEAAA